MLRTDNEQPTNVMLLTNLQKLASVKTARSQSRRQMPQR